MTYFEKGVRRLPAACDYPKKFDFNSPVYDILKTADIVSLRSNGQFNVDCISSPNDDKNYFIDARTVTDSTAHRTSSDIQSFANQIVGIRFSGAIVSMKTTDSLLSKVFQPTLLNYIVDLDLSHIQLSYTSQSILCRAINPIISGYCSIKRLSLVKTTVGVKGSISIFESLTGNSFIEELFMTGNCFTDAAVPALAKCLSHRQCYLKVLGIGDNEITAAGMGILAPVFGAHESLKSLNLNINPIGDDGTSLLFSAIRDGEVMKSINLSKCNIKSCKWHSSHTLIL